MVLTGVLAAVWIGAPLDNWIVIDIREKVPFLILLEPLFVAVLPEETHRNDSAALVLRAPSLDGDLAIVDLGLQISLPTILAKAMATV